MERLVPATAIVFSMALASPVSAVAADHYPVKPVRIVVPFPPGGSNDLLARVISQKFNGVWGQPAIIDNRPGGGSTIGIEVE